MKHSGTIALLFALLSTDAFALSLVESSSVTLTPTNAAEHGFTIAVQTGSVNMLTVHDKTNTIPCHVCSLVVESKSHDLTQFIPTMAYSPSETPDVFIHSYLPSMPEAAPGKLSFALTVSPAAQGGVRIVLRNRDARKTVYRIDLKDWKDITEPESGHVRK